MASSVSSAWSLPAIAILSSDFFCRMRNDDDCLRPFGKAAFIPASRFALCYDCAFLGYVQNSRGREAKALNKSKMLDTSIEHLRWEVSTFRGRWAAPIPIRLACLPCMSGYLTVSALYELMPKRCMTPQLKTAAQ